LHKGGGKKKTTQVDVVGIMKAVDQESKMPTLRPGADAGTLRLGLLIKSSAIFSKLAIGLYKCKRQPLGQVPTQARSDLVDVSKCMYPFKLIGDFLSCYRQPLGQVPSQARSDWG
jgi:hypothetical protein